jgi:hypothetical protein
VNCKDCKFDITNYEDKTRPSYWLECDASGIADEIYEKYGDDELPEHCGQFQPREELI